MSSQSGKKKKSERVAIQRVCTRIDEVLDTLNNTRCPYHWNNTNPCKFLRDKLSNPKRDVKYAMVFHETRSKKFPNFKIWCSKYKKRKRDKYWIVGDLDKRFKRGDGDSIKVGNEKDGYFELITLCMRTHHFCTVSFIRHCNSFIFDTNDTLDISMCIIYKIYIK